MKALALLALVFTLTAHAEVYTCVESGKTVYSQIPCSTNAVKIHAGEESAAERQRLRDAAARRQEAEDEHFSNCYGSNF